MAGRVDSPLAALLGAAVVDYRTSLADLALLSAITGIFFGLTPLLDTAPVGA